MAIELSLSATDLNYEELHELTGELCHDLLDEAGLEAEPVTEPAEAGTKGGEIEIAGQILLKAVGAGGAIVALVGVLKAYVQRKPSLQFELKKKGGDTVKIKADDLRGDDLTKLVQTIKKAVEGMAIEETK